MRDDLADRVRAGATLLDRVRPGWHRLISVDRLAMETEDLDVLGQLYGDFHAGFWAVTRPLAAQELFSSAELGYTLRDREQSHDDESGGRAEVLARFAALTSLWRLAILTRRSDPGRPDPDPKGRQETRRRGRGELFE